jgi:hypothetical protein
MQEDRIRELERQVAALERQVSVLTVKINNILTKNLREPTFGKWVMDRQQEYQDFQQRFPPMLMTRGAGGPS